MSIELIHGDCMDYLKACPDNAFDLAIVDPPYGIGESGGNESRNRVASNGYARKEWDGEAPPVAYFRELERVSRHRIIWGANHFADRLPCAASSCWVVWDKMTGASDFTDCELAYTSFRTAVRQFRFQWSGMLQGDMKCKRAPHPPHPKARQAV